MRLHRQAGILLGAVAALTACSNSDQGAGPADAATAANAGSVAASSSSSASVPSPQSKSSTATSAPAAPASTTTGTQAPAGAAKITSCKVQGKTVSVTGTVTNATDQPKGFVVAVEVRQGGKAVAGVPLLMTGVAPKATATASNTTVLKAAADSVTCIVKNVGDVG